LSSTRLISPSRKSISLANITSSVEDKIPSSPLFFKNWAIAVGRLSADKAGRFLDEEEKVCVWVAVSVGASAAFCVEARMARALFRPPLNLGAAGRGAAGVDGVLGISVMVDFTGTAVSAVGKVLAVT